MTRFGMILIGATLLAGSSGAVAQYRPYDTPYDRSAPASSRPPNYRGGYSDRGIAPVWHVEETVYGEPVWVGTWTRRGDSDIFDAVWRNVDNGEEVRDRLELVDTRNGIVFHRDGTDGEYMGQISRDGRSMNGTATWFVQGGEWHATAVSPRRY